MQAVLDARRGLDVAPQPDERQGTPQEQMRGLLAALDKPRKGSLLRLGPRRLECAAECSSVTVLDTDFDGKIERAGAP